MTADTPPEAPADRPAASAGREPAEGVDIPKQQSAGEAADNEAADDART
ncbi:gliding motility protein [Streptomyces sp. LN785]